MSAGCLKLRPEHLAEMIVRSEQAGAAWHVPLYRAALARELSMILAGPGQSIPSREMDPLKQRSPRVVMLGGDGDTAAGPADFPNARRCLRWASFVVLHGTGGEPEHYEMIVQAARAYGRVLVVECRGSRLGEWLALKARLASNTPGVIWRTPPGAAPHDGTPRKASAGTVLQ